MSPADRAAQESSYRRTRSIVLFTEHHATTNRQCGVAVSIFLEQLRSGDQEDLIPELLLQARHEIRPGEAAGRRRDQAPDYLSTLGDLNLLAPIQHAFDARERVAEIADRGSLHVIHVSITSG